MALIVFFWVMGNWFLYDRPVPGFYTIAISIWFGIGFLSSGLGLLGMYLAVIIETKKRPRAIVKRVFSGGSNRDL